MPASASRTGVALRLPPRNQTSAPTAAAPRKANHTYPLRLVTPKKVMAVTTAADAPALMPSSPGSASGLRVSAWSTAPASPRAAPASSPSRVRASRSSTTTSPYVPEDANSPCHTWATDSSFAPTAMLATATTARTPREASSPTARTARRAGGAATGSARCSGTLSTNTQLG